MSRTVTAESVFELFLHVSKSSGQVGRLSVSRAHSPPFNPAGACKLITTSGASAGGSCPGLGVPHWSRGRGGRGVTRWFGRLAICEM